MRNSFLGRFGALLLVVAPVGIALWVRHIVLHDTYLFVALSGERELFEVLQVALLDLTLAAAVALAWIEWKKRERALGVLHGLFALFVFLVIMEEINWGQRIFNIATPEILRSVNVQQEINLHNLDGLHQRQTAVMVLIGTYGVLSPLAWLFRALRERRWPCLLAAHPLAGTWFLPSLVFNCQGWIRIATGWPPDDTFLAQKLTSMIQEPVETMLYAAFLIMTLAWLCTCRAAAASGRGGFDADDLGHPGAE
jgi:hypothetical protein